MKPILVITIISFIISILDLSSSQNICISNTDSNCKSCHSVFNSICTYCNDGYYISPTLCLTPSTTVTNTNSQCSSYDINGKCNRCATGFYLKDSSSIQGVTTTSSFKLCVPCSSTNYFDPHCNDCTNDGTTTTCTQCASGYWIVGSASTNNCTNTGTICKSNCFICSSATTCILCNPGYYLDNSGTCQSCQSNCLSCSSSSVCSKCSTGYYLSSSNQCVACSTINTNCTLCGLIGSTATCFSCISGYHVDIDGVTCVNGSLADSSCQIGNSTSCLACNVPKYVNNKCVACPSSCSQCLNSINCTTCKSGFQKAIYSSVCNNFTNYGNYNLSIPVPLQNDAYILTRLEIIFYVLLYFWFFG